MKRTPNARKAPATSTVNRPEEAVKPTGAPSGDAPPLAVTAPNAPPGEGPALLAPPSASALSSLAPKADPCPPRADGDATARGDTEHHSAPQANNRPLGGGDSPLAAALAAELKERRGRRYRSYESVRRGLAAVANGVEIGRIEPKAGAVIVQALQAVAATLTAMEAAKLERAADAIERGADAK